MKRSDRLVAMTNYLIDHPMKLISLERLTSSDDRLNNWSLQQDDHFFSSLHLKIRIFSGKYNILYGFNQPFVLRLINERHKLHRKNREDYYKFYQLYFHAVQGQIQLDHFHSLRQHLPLTVTFAFLFAKPQDF